jgi:hypothetical protein
VTAHASGSGLLFVLEADGEGTYQWGMGRPVVALISSADLLPTPGAPGTSRC